MPTAIPIATVAELRERNADVAEFLRNPLDLKVENAGRLEHIWRTLEKLSGFPQPYLSGKERTYRRWSNTYSHQLIREDIRDVVEIKAVTDVETLYLLLPLKVGSPLSASSLARDIGVSYNSIRNWLNVFERFFLVFGIPTWTRKVSRAILKERKYYLWDYPRIKNPAARFENMVAAELFRGVHLWTDMGYGNFSLHFVKNKEKQEVDFLIVNDGEPFLLVETKSTNGNPSKSLLGFQKLFNIPAVQLTNGGHSYKLISNGDNKILIVPACQWLARLP